MRTVNADLDHDTRRQRDAESWEISLALSWCVIRIELPLKRSAPTAADGTARARSDRRAAAAHETPQPRPSRRASAANGWRAG